VIVQIPESHRYQAGQRLGPPAIVWYSTVPRFLFQRVLLKTPAHNALSPKEESRREKIIAASASVFFEKGFSRTSMDDVIAIIGGSKRTLYRYFPSKDELFFAVVTGVADRTMEGLKVKHNRDLRQTLMTFGESYLRTVISPDGLSLFRAVSSEAPHLPKLGERFLQDSTNRVSQLLADYFEEQNQRQPAEPIGNPKLAAGQFLALVRGQIHFAALLGGPIPSGRDLVIAVSQAVETFLHGAVSRK
jgi:AcrR family transcriptional regulator